MLRAADPIVGPVSKERLIGCIKVALVQHAEPATHQGIGNANTVAGFFTKLSGLGIQVKQNLHVIRNESDRSNNN